MSEIKKDERAGTLERGRAETISSPARGEVRRGGSNVSLTPFSLAGRISALARRQAVPSRISSGDLEVVFFCDTTGSMYPYFARVRDSIVAIAKRIAQEQVRAQFAVYAYKNHGDEAQHFHGVYPFLHQPLTADPEMIRKTLAEVRPGGGGDGLCAVEDAFHHLNAQARSVVGGKAKRVGVVVGDMPPHGVLDRVSGCPHEYDYRAEVADLAKKGFAFYSVFCSQESERTSPRKQKIQDYYQWLAREHGGKYLELAELDALVDVLLGICMKETGRLDSFIAQVGKQMALPATTRRLLLQLKAPDK
ncbi:VWA domain-containing protein [Candidatus Uhrbacteria bacterium]|nr:VWA domain-containing protein [Candidatus Uhrbacteria bacterium]